LSCVFETDESPFKLVNDTYIDGYFDDDQQKKFKYRKEDKEGRLQVERMKMHLRTDQFYFHHKKFNVLPDSDDFKSLVDTILNSKKSFHIDGRAGCGKTTLIKMIQKEIASKGILYRTLAPTNKACRLINGETMHRFSTKATGKYIRETLKFYKYIFIDEVSMMSEMFYKFFIVLKRMLPDVKFIIAGDFAQLLPVKDRVEDCNYKNSLALHELCDGNRLELTKCRRSDATLFNMLLPENIGKIKKTDFKNTMTNRHICFTNKKRIAINKMEMDKMIKSKRVKAFELDGLDYDPNSQDVRLCAGMPVIARKNSKELNIFNNETFTIKAIKQKVIVVVDEGKEQEVPIPEFTKMFNVAFCITTHKSQGATFDEPYTIHEFDQFDKRLKYVALSRATDINLINII
jgi:ATP-dependent exoDNAse (exonuclease V) alpha subunit